MNTVFRNTALALPLLLLVACRGGEPDETSGGGERRSEDVVTVRVAALSPAGTPWDRTWGRFQERVEAVPDSGIRLEMFVNGQLGAEETQLSGLRRNRVQMGGFSLQGLATIVPELSVILAPYLFESEAEVDFVMDEYLTETFREMFAAQGMTLLSWSEVGWTQIYATRPILTPEDADGAKMRASNAAGSRLFTDAIGAESVPVTFSEVIPALQTGLIDSGQSGIGIYAIAGLSQEAPHLTLTSHAMDTGLVLANSDWLEGLDERRRRIIVDSLDEQQAGREAIRADVGSLLSELRADPRVIVHDLDPAARAVWREAVVGTHQALIEEIGGRASEIYERIQAGKRAFRERDDAPSD